MKTFSTPKQPKIKNRLTARILAALIGTLAAAAPAQLTNQPDNEALGIDELCLALVPPAQTNKPQSIGAQNCGDRNIIDILWVYTPAALERIGSEAFIEFFTQINIDDVNTSFANSQLPFSIRTVGLIPTDYDESGNHLGLLQGQNDGVMDEVHAVRDALAADIVVLINDTGFCGLAYIAPDNEAFGFQKVTAGCLVNTNAFRHELGHNLGSRHFVADPGGFFPYSSGHVLTLNDGSTRGTAMGGNSLPHFSNPRVEYEGIATGVAAGAADSADNWLAFMQTVPMVADFRCSGDCNGNDIDDVTEILSGLAEDCDGNGVPDECQVDLNDNGIVDACDALPVIVRVPEDVPSLQLAVSMAQEGVHEVVVGPGTWIGPLNTFGKAITVRSSHGAGATVLDGKGVGRVAVFTSGETRGTVLDGFTITGGIENEGAGVFVGNSSPTIMNCVFMNNVAGSTGGGLQVTDGSPLIVDCVFESNSADWGGAVGTLRGSPEFERCVFSLNAAGSGGGGGVSSWRSHSSFVDCEFQSNSSGLSGGGLFIVDGNGSFLPLLDGTRFCENMPNHVSSSQWIDGGGNAFLESCACAADLTGDGVLDFFDISAFLTAFAVQDLAADFTGDGAWDFFDISAFLTAFSAGCS